MRDYVRLHVVPLDLREANDMVAALHRHHKPVVGHRFSLGVADDAGVVRGAAIIGRPVARMSGHKRHVVEVTRLVTDGTPNACSMLYGAAAKTAKCMGFAKIQTYILEGDEPGTSLKAAGWTKEAIAKGRQWAHTDGKARRTDQPNTDKARWSRQLATAGPADLRVMSEMTTDMGIFG